MKTSIRKALLGLIGTSVGMYMMVAPLATTVSANAAVQKMPVQTQCQSQCQDQKQCQNRDQARDQKQNQKHDKFSKEDMEKCARACHSCHQNDKNCRQTPVEAVKSCANELGFDVQTDTFTLVSKNQNTAVVQVIHDGNSYNVTLTLSDSGCWVVSTMS